MLVTSFRSTFSVCVAAFLLGPPLTHAQTTVLPTGVSLNPRSSIFEWAKIQSQAVKFVYLEATQGDFFQTEEFARNAQAAKTAGLRVGASLQFVPGADPMAQARLFAETVGVPDLPPAVEINIAPMISDPALFHNDLRVLLREVETLLQCRPLLYVETPFYDEHLGAAYADYDLWQRLDTVEMVEPQNAGRAIFWRIGQISGVKSMPFPVDFNRFLGSDTELAALGCT